MASLGWRLTRGRGAKQLSLILCGLSAVVIAFLGRADAALFDRVRAGLSDFAEPALSQLRGPLVTVEHSVDNAGSLFTTFQDNIALKKENAELRKWQNVALSLENKLHRYEILLNAAHDPALPSVTARVIGEASRPFIKSLVLNVGAEQQVKKGQAVVDERGLLGRIYVTGEKTSWVILLTDLNSRVPVVIEPYHRRAILTGDNTPAPQLELDVGDGPVKPGDRVVSTGDGGLLPPDLPIGTVMQEGSTLRVVLFARPGTSDFVSVKAYSLPEPPAATDPVPAATAAEEPKVPPATVTAGIAAHPAPPAMPLQSRNPDVPRFDGQDEEQDR
ncbi:MAG TPA: rod shape-determining protein MreC [Micropepsaceae bacterium]|nr:rod shape-determining protein MreC [Micropepsaceae bacterium]